MSRNYKIQNKEGIYFITFATVGWIDVFTRRNYRDILLDSFRYCQQEKGLVIYSWCVMSNHVHMIVRSKTGDLSGTIRDLKKFTAKKCIEAMHNRIESRREWMLAIFNEAGSKNSNNKNHQFWRQDNKPIELFSNHVMNQKVDYIHNNPVEAGIVENAEDYLYSSARDYAGMKGLLEVEFLD